MLCSGHSPKALTITEGHHVHRASGKGGWCLALSPTLWPGLKAPPPTVQPITPTQGPTKPAVGLMPFAPGWRGCGARWG